MKKLFRIILIIIILCTSIYNSAIAIHKFKVNRTAIKVSQILQTVYAPKDLDEFWDTSIKAERIMEFELVQQLFTLKGDSLTAYDLAKAVKVESDVAYGKEPRHFFTVYVVTPTGRVTVLVRFKSTNYGFSKLSDLEIITKEVIMS